MAESTNTVIVSGNLTKDPDLRALPSGSSVCSLRIAVNERTKINDEWQDRANYFTVVVWGKHGEACAKFLTKGRKVVVTGKLRWREYTHNDVKRESVEINVPPVGGFQVEWMPDGKKKDGAGGGGDDWGDYGGGFQANDDDPPEPQSDVPSDTSDFKADSGSPGTDPDDDIPFLSRDIPRWESLHGTRRM